MERTYVTLQLNVVLQWYLKKFFPKISLKNYFFFAQNRRLQTIINGQKKIIMNRAVYFLGFLHPGKVKKEEVLKRTSFRHRGWGNIFYLPFAKNEGWIMKKGKSRFGKTFVFFFLRFDRRVE